jgi:DNA-binding NtrC family response regulator
MRRRGPRFDERRSRDINRVKSDTGAILIVDDDPAQRRIVREIFGAGHMPVREASGGAEAVEIALPDRSGKGGSPLISLVVLDLNMPGMGGMEALEAIHAGSPDLPILVLTADGSVTRAVEAMRAGAQDYLIKPVSPQRLLTTARTLLQVSSLTGEVRRLRGERPNAGGLAGLVAESAAIRAAIEQAQKAAASSIPVMIGGESGVGKEIFARAIHADSLRSAAPFVAVNCGALPKDLIESILFGHEKGAFTGATERRQGKFREADGGTLFLDEVGCSIVSASSPWRFPRCASGGRISARSPICSSAASRGRKAGPPPASRPRRGRCWPPMTGPAMCGSWRTPSTARW